MNTLALERAPGRAALGRPLTPWYRTASQRHTANPYSMGFGEFRRVQVVRENASGVCWDGYQRTPGTEKYEDGSCQKKGKKKKKRKKKNKSDISATRENAARFPKKGEDATGGKTGEGKKKITDFSDKDGNGKVDAFEKSSSEYDSESSSGNE